MAKISKHHGLLCSCAAGCECLWRLDYRPLGLKGPRKRLDFPTKKAAERYLAETQTKVSRGEYIEAKQIPTFATVAEEWVKSKQDRRPSYAADLRARVDKYLVPDFGNLRLDQVSVAAIERLRDRLRDAGLAPRTVRGILQMVAGIFKLAIRRGQATANPCDRVERPHESARELTGDDTADGEVTPDKVLAPEEVQRLLAASEPGTFRTLNTMLVLTGLRSGEAFALRWSDCELDDLRIHVRRSLSWAHLQGEEIRPRFYPPKTKSGLRSYLSRRALPLN